jgi:hypothetical protein
LNLTADARMADLVAGELEVHQRKIAINTFTADAKELLNALTQDGQWVWKSYQRLFTGFLRDGAHWHNF